eukprot:gene23069-biopygen4287
MTDYMEYANSATRCLVVYCSILTWYYKKSRAEQSRAEQSGAEQSRAEQNRAEQNRTEQNRTEWNRAGGLRIDGREASLFAASRRHSSASLIVGKNEQVSSWKIRVRQGRVGVSLQLPHSCFARVGRLCQAAQPQAQAA